VTIDQSWHDPNAAWWAKLDRAWKHIESLRRVVDAYRAAKPCEIVPEPTDAPGRTAYRVRIRQQVPVVVSTIVGDVHNMRPALDSVAYEMAVRHLGRTLTRKELVATAFPICETPQEFDDFFDKERPIRASMFGRKERAALRLAQPFW
jgi:hypothetical protein